MPVYSVYEPPLRAEENAPDPARFVFVRDGFYFWAFLLTVLWLLWHRLWLIVVIYLILALGLEGLALRTGAGVGGAAMIGLLLSLLLGLEAGALRGLMLERRGWSYAGVAVGDGVETAERRFFRTWKPAPAPAAPPRQAATPAPASAPQPPSIVGLFPEPGAGR